MGIRRTGATLIELSVAIGITLILGAIAVPGFSQWRANTIRTAVVNDFVHSIHFARSEAIKRNAVVSICRSVDGVSCANALPNWSGGWIVFVNTDRDRPADTDDGETVLHRRGPVISGTLNSNRDSFSFRPYSQLDVNGTVTYCPPTGTEPRAVIISHTGRPRTSNKDASGKPIKCEKK